MLEEGQWREAPVLSPPWPLPPFLSEWTKPQCLAQLRVMVAPGTKNRVPEGPLGDGRQDILSREHSQPPAEGALSPSSRVLSWQDANPSRALRSGLLRLLCREVQGGAGRQLGTEDG